MSPSPRERILRAAVEVVAKRGMDKATVRLVIARAGVSSRTFYEQFEGLDDRLVEVMDRTLVEVCALATRWRVPSIGQPQGGSLSR